MGKNKNIRRKEVFKYYQDRFAEICKKLGGDQHA